MRTSVHTCVCDVFAIYDDYSLPRLIMIIIKINILYFIQIRHTDDFPSTGTPASKNKTRECRLVASVCQCDKTLTITVNCIRYECINVIGCS